MGFKKNDILLENIIKHLSYNILSNPTNKYVPDISGPVYFTNMWELYNVNNYAFPISYFYSYTFEDKMNNNTFKISDNNYAIHMWGHSWKDNKNENNYNSECNFYIEELYLSGLIIENYETDNISENIIFKANLEYKETTKIKIVHIMGLFYTGGIERYIYYIDKYGDHDKYIYYLIHISNKSYIYNLKNIKLIKYSINNFIQSEYHNFCNKNILSISPDLIIDHYSIYIEDNNSLYKNIIKNNIIYFIHSAICYNNNIDKLNINNAIHLYNELNKHYTWNNIKNNYYVTLGTELTNTIDNTRSNNKIIISIIGRITEEKIPINFLYKLCDISIQLYDKIEINIYGEKDKVFNIDYVNKFDEAVIKSKINVYNFVNPNEINNIYLNTNILLIPSIYETGSFSCIEAFSFGIPVIARNVYGLKFLIENNINGYLCNNDDDLLLKIKDNESLLKIIGNYKIIKQHSLKYNIKEKINDFENIISKNICSKNAIIITSVINCGNKKLSYYHTRSIFNIKERYEHTLKTIESIRSYMDNTDIIFLECSNLDGEYQYIEDNISSNVDYYFNFNNIDYIKNSVLSELKGFGEVNILLEGINKIIDLQKRYKNIFKISGRYYLNELFDNKLYLNNYNIFTNWDNSLYSYCTIFYKINFNDIYIFKNSLEKSIDDIKKKESIEICIYKYFKKNIKLYDKLNISGLLATEGYMVNI